jgi:cobalt-zinc-cadmium efflux system outer membrane protein
VRRELLAMCALLATGCAGLPRGDGSLASQEAPPAVGARAAAPPPPETIESPPPLPLDRPLAEGELVSAVLARNPSLAAMRATWLAARARPAQMAAMPEPTLGFALAPLSLRASDPGQELRITQPIPWTQRLRQRGDEARADAEAAGDDLVTLRLQLIAESKQAVAAYWQAAGASVSNRAERDLIAQGVRELTAAYGAGAGSRVEVLRAEMGLNEIDHHAILLVHDRAIAVARLNLLLHRSSDDALPPPPATLSVPAELPAPEQLTQIALERRPDLAAAAARRRAAEALAAAVGLQDLPDLSVSAGYSTMWSDPAMRLTVGVDVALPLNRDRRAAERAEARAGIERARAEQEALVDRVRFEVREGYEHAYEYWHILHLSRERMVPSADQLADAAAAAVASGGRDYAGLLDARREQVTARWDEQVAIAELHARLAELERLVGGGLDASQPHLGASP